MCKHWFIVCIMIFGSQATANEIFGKADTKAGQALHDKYCISCHASSFGEDGRGIYLREDRKVKSPKGLVAQVRNCNTMLGLKWFDDEELNVAAYLNQQYYKFDQPKAQ